MAITLNQTFHVKAPVDDVWKFLLDPYQVVTCMPGAALYDVEGDDTFLGNIKVKVGPITTIYKGRVRFTSVDHEAHVIEMMAEGVDTGGGGTAMGTMFSRVEASPNGGTTVVAEANAEVTGRVMQFGRGMIQGISEQLFKQFAASVAERLEAAAAVQPVVAAEEEGAAVAAVAAAEPVMPAQEQRPINAIAVTFKTVWAAVSGFFGHLFGRSSDAGQ
jgi:carbon monoxide dehydrogenase subunit G